VSNGTPGTTAITPFAPPGQTKQTAWLIRKTSADIESLKGAPNLRFEQRPGVYRVSVNGKFVDVFFLMLAIGTQPFDPAWIHLGIVGSEHQEGMYGGMLESLATQDTMTVVLIGDSKNIENFAVIPNTVRQFARERLAELSNMPPWSSEEWQTAVTALQEENGGDKLRLWDRFGKPAA
jgi:hypothetical protein